MPDISDVVNALKECKDPELNADIVSIGLVYGIEIEGDKVKLTLTMTSPMCPVTSLILADAQLRVEAVQGVKTVDVDLVWDPLWSPDMMDDDLKYSM